MNVRKGINSYNYVFEENLQSRTQEKRLVFVEISVWREDIMNKCALWVFCCVVFVWEDETIFFWLLLVGCCFNGDNQRGLICVGEANHHVDFTFSALGIFTFPFNNTMFHKQHTLIKYLFYELSVCKDPWL